MPWLRGIKPCGSRKLIESRMSQHVPGAEALLCALVLAPNSYSRNRFFALFTDPKATRARRRASKLRGIIRQLLGDRSPRAELTGEQLLEDGQVLIRYQVKKIGYSRTVALSAIEASVLKYALHRAEGAPLDPADRERVEAALQGLTPPFTPDSA